VESDIIEHPEIKNIFIQAGCDDFFHLETANTDAYTVRDHIAASMSKYMGLDREQPNQEESYPEDDPVLNATDSWHAN
jgi:hypothetical protein